MWTKTSALRIRELESKKIGGLLFPKVSVIIGKNQENKGIAEVHVKMALVALNSLGSHIAELYKGAGEKEECDQLRNKLALLERKN